MDSPVDLGEVERELADLDARYRPVAQAPVDGTDPEAIAHLGERVAAALAELRLDARADSVLRALIKAYQRGDEETRRRIRADFDRHPSFRWAANLPRDWRTAAEFRDRLIHLSARDQGADTRDEILALQDLCARARGYGIDVTPILDEVAGMSSEVDRYGMGSMRDVLLRYSRPR